jgi:ADP-ribose pyrophosphatase YjhB (NUDIX family)
MSTGVTPLLSTGAFANIETTMGNEYATGSRNLGGWIDEETYSIARKNLVIATTDVLLVRNKKEAFLGYRTSHPLGVWWIFGGRMRTGETFTESAARCLNDEFNDLNVQPGDMKPLGYYSVYWNDGVTVDHALLAAYSYEVDYRIDIRVPKHHSEGKWFSFTEILNNDTFHPCIKQIVKDYTSLLSKQ